MRSILVMALVLVLPITFSGCVSCDPGPPVTARDINNASPSGGTGGYDLGVLVTDGPGGGPLPDSGVVAYWEGTTVTEWGHPSVHVNDDDVVVEPYEEVQTVEPTRVARMMADEDGKVHARLPTERIVGLVVAKDGFTEEWVANLASGPRGGSDTLTIPLYQEYLEVTTNGSWSPGAASTGAATNSQYAWQPTEAEFGETAAAKRGYAARIVELTVTLTWENSPNSFGDLGIGIGTDAGDGPTFFHDDEANAAAGTQTETVTLGVQEMVDHGIVGDRPIHIGPATQTGYVAPFGIDYTLRVEADFDTALADLERCQGGTGEDDNEGVGVSVPGPQVPILLAALAVMVAIVRRAHRP